MKFNTKRRIKKHVKFTYAFGYKSRAIKKILTIKGKTDKNSIHNLD